MIKEKISKIRKWHSVVSSIIFFLLLGFCSWAVNLKITNISLSEFGIQKETSIIWNGILCLMSVLLYLESIKNIINHIKESSKYLYVLFTLSSVCLFLTGLIDMSHLIFHNSFAVLYFIGYSSSVFLFGKHLLHNNFRMGISSIVISILSIIIPMYLVYAFPGLAIPEIAHTIFVFSWIIIMSWENEYKNFLKKIGF